MSRPLYLPAMAVATCLGTGKEANARAVFSGMADGLVRRAGFLKDRMPMLGALREEPPPLPPAFAEFDSRNNRLIATLLEEIASPVARAIREYGADRVAVVLGTSTSGIAEGEQALAHLLQQGRWPERFRYSQQETGSAATFVAAALGLRGPAYVVATACSSSAKVFASARRLIRQGIVDAAIVGGADTMCALTVTGFASLEAIAMEGCLPFSANRGGISIGEGGALFLMTREPAEIALLGVGESSDAHHISAPIPSGEGAITAMRQALQDAGKEPSDIAYVNLHGTGTILNDAMESLAVNTIFGPATVCSSTKAMTGHTLGAAGAVEAAFLWLTLSADHNPDRRLPPHVWDGERAGDLPPLHFATSDERLRAVSRLTALSSSFAFGGSNCALIFGRGEP